MHYCSLIIIFFFFFNDTATTEIYTLSLHDALPISGPGCAVQNPVNQPRSPMRRQSSIANRRSEEHTSELQSPCNLVCSLLLEKKKKIITLKEHQKKKKRTSKQ